MKCPDCGAVAYETIMPENGVNYRIWACTASAYHWGNL